MMARKSQYISTSTLFSILLLACALLYPAASQSQQTQQPPSNMSSQPVSLAHLYWHFLSYQYHLDTKASALVAQGKDGTWLNSILQTNLGFSDADFAFIRTSSVRLTSEVQALNTQAAAIQAAGTTSMSQAQLSALSTQRETYISNEIAYLQQNLSPAEITTLQSFLYQLFSLPNPAAQANSSTGQSSSTTVQQ
jgi:hypothetical protein